MGVILTDVGGFEIEVRSKSFCLTTPKDTPFYPRCMEVHHFLTSGDFDGGTIELNLTDIADLRKALDAVEAYVKFRDT